MSDSFIGVSPQDRLPNAVREYVLHESANIMADLGNRSARDHGEYLYDCGRIQSLKAIVDWMDAYLEEQRTRT